MMYQTILEINKNANVVLKTNEWDGIGAST
jgi:hypothetical protein